MAEDSRFIFLKYDLCEFIVEKELKKGLCLYSPRFSKFTEIKDWKLPPISVQNQLAVIKGARI